MAPRTCLRERDRLILIATPFTDLSIVEHVDVLLLRLDMHALLTTIGLRRPIRFGRSVYRRSLLPSAVALQNTTARSQSSGACAPRKGTRGYLPCPYRGSSGWAKWRRRAGRVRRERKAKSRNRVAGLNRALT